MEGHVGQGLCKKSNCEPYEAAAPEWELAPFRKRPQASLEGVSPHNKINH